ncbi:hypothetical protein K438DRAFT_857134 [Mycena galopus ATCC 62051]|nr:hypothetical protein K438DRAFT_857134 [Mycena galopus ATCC 62051]
MFNPVMRLSISGGLRYIREIDNRDWKLRSLVTYSVQLKELEQKELAKRERLKNMADDGIVTRSAISSSTRNCWRTVHLAQNAQNRFLTAESQSIPALHSERPSETKHAATRDFATSPPAHLLLLEELRVGGKIPFLYETEITPQFPAEGRAKYTRRPGHQRLPPMPRRQTSRTGCRAPNHHRGRYIQDVPEHPHSEGMELVG